MNAEATPSERWIEKTCLLRLGDSTSQGLAETVLFAAIKHRAPEELGLLVKNDMVKALKRLEARGRVAHSAGRWRRLR